MPLDRRRLRKYVLYSVLQCTCTVLLYLVTVPGIIIIIYPIPTFCRALALPVALALGTTPGPWEFQ